MNEGLFGDVIMLFDLKLFSYLVVMETFKGLVPLAMPNCVAISPIGSTTKTNATF